MGFLTHFCKKAHGKDKVKFLKEDYSATIDIDNEEYAKWEIFEFEVWV